MKKMIDCPLCDGKAKLKFKYEVRIFRREEFKIYEFFYKCHKCEEEFTTTEVDEINILQVYNQYREKHNIPFPSEIKKLREEYNISANKMSQILGFGVNQFRNYENGEIPNLSNANLIKAIQNLNVFTKLLEDKKEFLQKKDYNKIVKKIEDIKKNKVTHSLLDHILSKNYMINKFTGYRSPNIEKLLNVIIFFLQKSPFIVKLNKLLFYSDFLHFKYYGFSITGFKYAAIDMGPVLDQYSFIFDYLKSENYLSVENVEIGDDLVEKLIANKTFDESLFSQSELEILRIIEQNLIPIQTKKLIELSHSELAWKENSAKKNLIDYQKYAPLIKIY